MKILVEYQTVTTKYRAGYYLTKALRKLGHEVKRVGFDHETKNDADLYIAFDPMVSVKRAKRNFYWVVDSTRVKELPRGCEYDQLFIAGKDFDSYPDAVWLPMAADPDIHKRIGEPEYDLVNIGMYGNGGGIYGYDERKRLFEIAHDNGYSIYKQNNIYGEEYSKELSRGKLILNRPGLTDLNMRFFESMAVGCMLWYPIGDYREVATPEHHYVSFKDDEEFLYKLEKYRKDDKARKQIEKNARELILAKHTYKHRALEILSYV